jgi:hypothetical protein
MKDQKTSILRYAEIVFQESRLVKAGGNLRHELIDEKRKIEHELSLDSNEIMNRAQQLLGK